MEPPTPAPGQLLSERYELRRRLGSGGAGVVYAAHDHLLGRDVAVKLLHAELADDPQAAERFRTEAAAAAKVSHPNAVTIYDIDRHADRDYLVMELVDGPALSTVLADGSGGQLALPWPAVAGIGHSVAAALGAAHQRATVHRDVKPGNVLLSSDGAAKVADFGIARALGEAASRATTPGTVIGTARYLAPEQLRDDPVDVRADVYSLGLTLHEALTGRPPWGEGTATEIAGRRLAAELPPPSAWAEGLPPGLDEVIARATRLEPHERFEDGAAMARALQPFVPDDVAWRLAGIARAAVGADAPGPPPRPGSTGPGRVEPHTAQLTAHGGEATATQQLRGGEPPGGHRPAARRRRSSPGRRLLRTAAVGLLLAGAGVAGAGAMLWLADVELDTDGTGVVELVEQVVADDLLDELRARFVD